MNNIAGNFPVLVTTVRKSLDEDYRTALYIFWPGFIAISGVLFFVASLPLMNKKHKDVHRSMIFKIGKRLVLETNLVCNLKCWINVEF